MEKSHLLLESSYRESELGRLDLPRALGAGTACLGGKYSHHLKGNWNNTEGSCLLWLFLQSYAANIFPKFSGTEEQSAAIWWMCPATVLGTGQPNIKGHISAQTCGMQTGAPQLLGLEVRKSWQVSSAAQVYLLILNGIAGQIQKTQNRHVCHYIFLSIYYLLICYPYHLLEINLNSLKVTCKQKYTNFAFIIKIILFSD